MIAPPLPPDDLLARADLAGIAKVVSVEPGLATLRFRRIDKGHLPGWLARIGLRRIAKVRLRMAAYDRTGAPILGSGWDDHFTPGERVTVYLVRQGEEYATCWWNAVQREH